MQVDKWGLKNAYFCYIVNVWVIIDPHWNLEETDALFFSRVAQVIIDPHWNLEIGHNLFVTASISVIIDPHWNLETLLPISYQDIRISNNRSTLEFRDV